MARPANGYWQDGVRIVSVTEALRDSKVRRLMGSVADLERRGRIGSAVHQAAAILDANRTTWDKAPREWLEPFDAVDPEVKPFVLAWEAFKRDMHFVPRLVEHTFITKTGITQFATTLDREGLLMGAPAIVEIKTPKKIEPWWGVQLAGQALATTCALGPPLVRPYKYKRWVAQIFSSGRRQYKPVPYEDEREFDVFLWSLGLAVWNREHYRMAGDDYNHA